MRKIILPLMLLLAASGCDIVSDPKEGLTGPTVPGNDSVVRRVLLEDCTGFRCNNCPQAANMAQSLKNVYGDRLVIVGVHMKQQFAGPEWPYNDGIYDTDFRTEAGNAYDQTFSIIGLPSGLIDRTPYNNIMAMGIGSWSEAVAARMELPPLMDTWFEGLQYDSGANTVSGTVKVAVLEPINGDHNLTIYLTEDHVIDWQLDGVTNIPDYDHRHVLRGALNSPWGQSLITGDAQPGDTLTATFSYPLPPNVLQPANCALVAYVYSTAGADQYEVKQVVERKIIP